MSPNVPCPSDQEQYRHADDCLPGMAEAGSQEKTCKASAHPQPLQRLSPPLHPTTKEAEAANVLMNLSGKGAERGGQPRIEPCTSPLQSHHPTKAPLYACPVVPGRKDPGGRKELAPCDEVPQINEKDLVPLATQVLCQFCSLQCEDLVELTDHVLAAHHTPEADTVLSSPQKKVRVSPKAVEKGGVVVTKGEEERQQEAATSSTAMIVVLQQATGNSQDKKTRRKERLKRGNSDVDKGSNSGEPSSCEENSQQENCTEEWQPPVVGDGPETSQPQPDLPTPALPTNNLCDKDQDWLKGQAGRSVTELVPVASGDALAMAMESSQIRILEAKVTILMCLECSSGFTDPQEYGGHACDASQPLILRGPDGSVTLTDLPPGTVTPHLQASDMRLFPDFFIQQTAEGGGRGLQMVHLSGRMMRLHTNCPLAYLGEQLISFRSLSGAIMKLLLLE